MLTNLNSTGGQNPTVKIRWGDEDRGTAVSPSTAWDNEVTISTNQAAGTFFYHHHHPQSGKSVLFPGDCIEFRGFSGQQKPGRASPSAPVGVKAICRAGGISTVLMPTTPLAKAVMEPPRNSSHPPNLQMLAFGWMPLTAPPSHITPILSPNGQIKLEIPDMFSTRCR